LTKNRNGLKTVKVSAGTVVILLHEKPGPFWWVFVLKRCVICIRYEQQSATWA
jgi:predicted NUDIX family NTP pyrophosphohydrolase